MPAAVQIVPLINGRSYDWASVRMQLLGITIYGVTQISYEESQEMVNNYGAGNMPVSRGYGKYEAKASITLEKKEVERIKAALPVGARIMDIAPFPITVTFSNDSNVNITDKLMNCQFMNNKLDMKSGDTNIEVPLDIIVSHIDRG
jgi:hypothetical protein